MTLLVLIVAMLLLLAIRLPVAHAMLLPCLSYVILSEDITAGVAIQRIVAGWPQNFDARRAAELGFQADPDFETIIRIHIEDELAGKIAT
jgi:hypothetical protein